MIAGRHMSARRPFSLKQRTSVGSNRPGGPARQRGGRDVGAGDRRGGALLRSGLALFQVGIGASWGGLLLGFGPITAIAAAGLLTGQTGTVTGAVFADRQRGARGPRGTPLLACDRAGQK